MAIQLRTLLRQAAALGAAAMLLLLPSAAHAADTQSAGDLAAQVVALTNVERANVGLPPLALAPELAQSAQSYADVLASGACFAHTCGPIPDLRDRAGSVGYQDWTAIGENIAGGQPTAEDVVAGWMSSPGHRANLLSENYTEIGVGVSSGPGQYGIYWTQTFGARAYAPPDFLALPEPDPAAEPSAEEWAAAG